MRVPSSLLVGTPAYDTLLQALRHKISQVLGAFAFMLGPIAEDWVLQSAWGSFHKGNPCPCFHSFAILTDGIVAVSLHKTQEGLHGITCMTWYHIHVISFWTVAFRFFIVSGFIFCLSYIFFLMLQSHHHTPALWASQTPRVLTSKFLESCHCTATQRESHLKLSNTLFSSLLHSISIEMIHNLCFTHQLNHHYG